MSPAQARVFAGLSDFALSPYTLRNVPPTGPWVALLALSIASAVLALRLFPQAFPIVQLDLKMDREAALDGGAALMEREQLGPADYRQAASFASDSEAQTFIELEGGGKEAYARTLRDGLYAGLHLAGSPVQGRREARDADPVPPGRRAVRLPRAARGAARRARRCAADEARAIAERKAARRLARRPRAVRAGRAVAGAPAGRARRSHLHLRTRHAHAQRGPLPPPPRRLRRSPDRSHAFHQDSGSVYAPLRRDALGQRGHRRRSAASPWCCSTSSAASRSGCSGCCAIAGCSGDRRHRGASVIALLQLLASLNDWPLLWMSYDTAVPRATFIAQQVASAASRRSSASRCSSGCRSWPRRA